MKSKTTIFKQLLGSVLLPVVMLIAIISVYNFFQKQEEIREDRKESIEQVAKDIGEFLAFFDKSILEIEKEMSTDAHYYSHVLVDSVFRTTENIRTANLEKIREEIGMSSLQDIYIVDRTGTIINTTFIRDLGLNFFERGEWFVNHFNEVWDSQKFIEDRISIETNTKLPKKYTYQSTRDTQYVVELGLYNKPSIALVEHFIKHLDDIANRYEGIDSVSLFFGTDEFDSYQGHHIPDDEMKVALGALSEQETRDLTNDKDGITYTTEYHHIQMADSHLHDGYILRVVHNNEMEKALLREELWRFGVNLLIFVLPIFLLILWRARVISRPITDLVRKTEEIKSGSLNERVPVTGRNEITDLGNHFNSMVEQLQQSYESLEQKVEDRTQELRSQKELVEEKNKEILDSIAYAKRIQRAILPPDQFVKKCLPESFVLYKPKDIVAGDFYWLHYLPKPNGWDVDGDRVLFAAADCTGHGVPGAMVSVVCCNALNRAVKEFGLVKPGNILNKVRELVIETFEESEEEVKDGMDISLCMLNTDTLKLEYAGANNPLWVLRKDAVEMHEIKATKQPIGRGYDDKSFENHELQLESGDKVFLFTDGFADQFGGPKGKKYKYKPFKNFLIETSAETPTGQAHKLDDELENWMNGYEQIDDVCVIGVRV